MLLMRAFLKALLSISGCFQPTVTTLQEKLFSERKIQKVKKIIKSNDYKKSSMLRLKREIVVKNGKKKNEKTK